MDKNNKSYPNRWLIATFGVIMQICLGTVYGWSIFTKPLQQLGHWSLTEVTIVFTIAIGSLGIAAALGGMVVDRKGPRFVATIGALLFGLGTLLTGWGVTNVSIWTIYIAYGVLAGLGNGLCYITPISVLVKWFPDKRGMITGIAVMGFGIGAFIMTTLVPMVLKVIGMSATFYLLGAIFVVLTLIAAQFMVNPPEGYAVAAPAGKKKIATAASVKPAVAVASKDFWLFWITLFLNISAGIALISQASPMVQEIFKQTPTQAGIIIGVFSVFNGLGRLFWSWMSDAIGRRNVFLIFFASQALLFLVLPYISNLAVFMVVACYIYSCYGGGFSTMPAFVADSFGSKYLGTIYGFILTAWSVGSIVGPILYSSMHGSYGYSTAFVITGVSLIIAMVFPLLVGRGKKLVATEQN
ncbi:MAG: OFA family MFS transporter [Bacillota bacterium]